MRKIIINADDFGLTTKINEAVLRAHRNGTLTSATLMANGLAVKEAVEIAMDNPKLGVGIHLNLTVLKPILPYKEVTSLINSQGFFNKAHWKLPFKKGRQARDEWEAQINKLLDMGLKPTHLDSHHHIHLYPPFTKIILDLARHYGIPCIRLINPRSIEFMYIGGLFNGFMTKEILTRSWKYAQKIQRPCTVVGIENFNVSKITELIDRLGLPEDFKGLQGIHELFLHPGLNGDKQLDGVSSLKDQRQKDLELLLDPKIKEILSRGDIELVNYSAFH